SLCRDVIHEINAARLNENSGFVDAKTEEILQRIAIGNLPSPGLLLQLRGLSVPVQFPCQVAIVDENDRKLLSVAKPALVRIFNVALERGEPRSGLVPDGVDAASGGQPFHIQESRSAQCPNHAINDLLGLGVDARRKLGGILLGAQSRAPRRSKQDCGNNRPDEYPSYPMPSLRHNRPPSSAHARLGRAAPWGGLGRSPLAGPGPTEDYKPLSRYGIAHAGSRQSPQMA